MSNFICPTCGFNNIDCGKAGYKTAREIDRLRKTLIRVNTLLSEHIRPCIFKNATTASVPIATLECLVCIIEHCLSGETEQMQRSKQ